MHIPGPSTLTLIIGLAVGALLGAQIHGAVAGTPNPRALNLTLSDMPAGFTQSKDQLLQNPAAAKAAQKSISLLNKEGRVLTSFTEFDRAGLTGLRLISSEVVLYKSDGDARADYLRSVAGLTRAKNPTPKRMSLGPVGTGSTAFQISQSDAKSLPFTADLVEFYRGSYAVQVGIAGITGTFDVSLLGTLAHLVDGRIKHAG